MLKPMIAGVTALSLTLATASPLQAQGLDREDAGKLLFGLAAIAILGAALDSRDRRGPEVETVSRGIDPNRSWSDLNRETRYDNARYTLPGRCLRNVDTRFGSQRMFAQRCLERNYHDTNSLPARCAVRIYTDNGPRRGFDPHCLHEQGYRSDRRH
jgi:hypothetical protein